MKNKQLDPVMKETNTLRHLIFLVLMLMVPLFVVTKYLFISFAQNIDKTQKTFTKEIFKDEPIDVISIKSNGRQFNLNTANLQANGRIKDLLVQDNDWFKDFAIDFKNVSAKPITYVNVACTFPETRLTGHPMVYFFKYGFAPDYPNRNNEPAKILAPNETGQIVLSAEKFQRLKSFLSSRNHTLADLTQAVLTIQTVFFADGTYWFGGTFYRPDPNRPGKYIPGTEN